MGNRVLLIDCCNQLLGRLRKEKGQVFLARKLSVLRFSMLNFRAQKSMQSEFIALSPFLPMVFFKIILALLLLSKGKTRKISTHQIN